MLNIKIVALGVAYVGVVLWSMIDMNKRDNKWIANTKYRIPPP
jgi:hypothetical protein